MNYGPEAWRHLGTCLRAARDGRSRAEIARETRISVGTIEDYETGKVYRRPPDKMWRLLNHYGWTPDSLYKVLDGGLPTYVPKNKRAPAPRPPFDGIEEWIREVIRNHPEMTDREKTRKMRRFDDLLRATR